jgi:ABC-type transport system involved in Fe-S cluster assembly fused permease/ATPase subunit
MSLSHEFHSNKSTSDLYVSVSQGRSVTGFIDTILFRITPMFVDLCVAFIYFYYLFGSYMALTVSTVSVVYMWTTTKYGTKANSIRKDYNTAARKEVVYMWDSLENWQTVKVRSLNRNYLKAN